MGAWHNGEWRRLGNPEHESRLVIEVPQPFTLDALANQLDALAARVAALEARQRATAGPSKGSHPKDVQDIRVQPRVTEPGDLLPLPGGYAHGASFPGPMTGGAA